MVFFDLKSGRTFTWITPCKRSTARGLKAVSSLGNSVGVQPTTGLGWVRDVSTPSYACRLARGYPYQTPLGVIHEINVSEINFDH